MSDLTAPLGVTAHLGHLDARLVRQGAVGGLLGGLVLFAQIAIYDGVSGMGFWSLLNSCFAAFVFPDTSRTTRGEPTMAHDMTDMARDSPLVASHLIVGALLHLAVSAAIGIAFVVLLALLLRAGIRLLANPVTYVIAAMIGGALLYLVVIYAVAPVVNPEIVQFTPRVQFFVGHLLFGATVGAFVAWRSAPGQHAAPA